MTLLSIILLMTSAALGAGIGFCVWRAVRGSISWQFAGNILVFLGAFVGALLFLQFHKADQAPSLQRQPDVVVSDTPDREPQISTQSAARILSSDNILLATLQDKDPAFAERMTKQLGEGPLPEPQVSDYAITYGVDAALGFLPRASNEAIVSLIEGLALSTRTLASVDPKACYGWLYGGYGYEPFDFARFRKSLGDELLGLQFVLFAEMVKSAGDRVPDYDRDAAAKAVSRANFQMLQFAGVENTGLITGGAGPRNAGPDNNGQGDNSEYVIACQARFLLYQSLLVEEAPGDAIRHLFLQSLGTQVE